MSTNTRFTIPAKTGAKTNVRNTMRQTTVNVLETVTEATTTAKVLISAMTDGAHLLKGELESARLNQELERIEDLVTDFGMPQSDADIRKQNILNTYLGKLDGGKE